MANMFLLMKLDILLHGKAIWKMKWQFLLFILVFGGLVLAAIYQPPKLFRISYYNGDKSYEARVAINNFVDGLRPIAEIKEVREFPQPGQDDAFVYFPEGFAEKWKHFQALPIQVYILSPNPIHQALLEESFAAYQDILLASESMIRLYNQELDLLGLSPGQWTKANFDISIDFISMAFNRNHMFLVKSIDALPASLTKAYFFLSLSLFLGLLFSILASSLEIQKKKYNQRLFISKIGIKDYFVNLLFLRFILILSFLLCLWLTAFFLKIKLNSDYYLALALVLAVANLAFWLISHFFAREADYLIVMISSLFIFALLGGAFLPISFLPASWMPVVTGSPFYLTLLYLGKAATSSDQAGGMGIGLVVLGLLAIGNYVLLRSRPYA